MDLNHFIHVGHLQDVLDVAPEQTTRSFPPAFFICPADITMMPMPVLST
jgi:hypothetical protein